MTKQTKAGCVIIAVSFFVIGVIGGMAYAHDYHSAVTVAEYQLACIVGIITLVITAIGATVAVSI